LLAFFYISPHETVASLLFRRDSTMATVSDHLYATMTRAALETASLRDFMIASSSFDGDESGRNNHHQSTTRRHYQHGNDGDNPAACDDEFHLKIPAILTQSGGGLARMNQQLLANCMEPVVKSLRALDAESLLGLERVEDGARLCDGYVVKSQGCVRTV
jgi:hypothetical protein